MRDRQGRTLGEHDLSCFAIVSLKRALGIAAPDDISASMALSILFDNYTGREEQPTAADRILVVGGPLDGQTYHNPASLRRGYRLIELHVDGAVFLFAVSKQEEPGAALTLLLEQYHRNHAQVRSIGEWGLVL